MGYRRYSDPTEWWEFPATALFLLASVAITVPFLFGVGDWLIGNGTLIRGTGHAYWMLAQYIICLVRRVY